MSASLIFGVWFTYTAIATLTGLLFGVSLVRLAQADYPTCTSDGQLLVACARLALWWPVTIPRCLAMNAVEIRVVAAMKTLAKDGTPAASKLTLLGKD